MKKVAQRKRKPSIKAKKRESNRICGAFFIFFGVFGIFKLGFLGILCLNLFRIFLGDVAVIGLAALVVLGAYLLVSGTEPKLKKNWVWGLSGLILSLLLVLHAMLFGKLDLHSHFINITWQYLQNDLVAGDIGTSVGGGMLGAFFYAPAYFLFSQVGTYIFGSVLAVLSLCVFFEVSFTKVLQVIGVTANYFIRGCSVVLRKLFETVKSGYIKIKKHNKESHEQKIVKKQKELAQQKQQIVADNTQQEQIKEQEHVTETEFVKTNSWNTEKNETNEAEESTGKSTRDDSSGEVLITGNSVNPDYKLPGTELLQEVAAEDQSDEYKKIEHNTKVLKETFKSFGVDVEIKKAILGPSVTKYELHPAIGVKVSKIVGLTDDLALALAAKDIRIEAPIPGKSLIGIEVPNQKVSTVSFRSIIEEQKRQHSKLLEVPLGRDIAGNLVTADLGKMPHLLIAGSTGSGKSVAINGIITSLLMNCPPHLVKLMLVDPKKVELGVYNGIPHLLTPVVTNPKKAAKALNKLVEEMERRYELFANTGQRNIAGYNEMVERQNKEMKTAEQLLPYIVIVVDELSDLMMVASNEVEDAIIRLAQMARAAGIHMILATQRPSVDVITGLIKANVPSRMAFAVSSGTDSRTIIDSNGAEKLLGRGDMLFLPMGLNKPIRVQGAFISDQDVANIVAFVKEQQPAEYDESLIVSDEETQQNQPDDAEDELFEDAVKLIAREQSCSISMLQRRFRIGYNRAARLVDELEAHGMIGPSEGSKPRKVFVQRDDDSTMEE
ncbi:DNA translocase FtsK [Liquorilactobacillus mali]|nr:DNA translocase FtsK [Liquorilactobacillus mali]MDN7145324.1 DNA translocase FtsK [Liquorilactobacillus mali]